MAKTKKRNHNYYFDTIQRAVRHKNLVDTCPINSLKLNVNNQPFKLVIHEAPAGSQYRLKFRKYHSRIKKGYIVYINKEETGWKPDEVCTALDSVLSDQIMEDALSVQTAVISQLDAPPFIASPHEASLFVDPFFALSLFFVVLVALATQFVIARWYHHLSR